MNFFKKKPSHAFELKKLDSKTQKMYTESIRRFYLENLPVLNEISKLPKLRKHFGATIEDLGIEHGLEACYELFEEGALELIANSKDNFIVLLHLPGGDAEMIYRVENGKTHK